MGAISKSDKISIRIEDKEFEYARLDRLRCDWAMRYGLVGEEGPAYIGSETNVMPPEKITPEKLAEGLRQTDHLQKRYLCIVEKCLAVCPAKGTSYHKEQGNNQNHVS